MRPPARPATWSSWSESTSISALDGSSSSSIVVARPAISPRGRIEPAIRWSRSSARGDIAWSPLRARSWWATSAARCVARRTATADRPVLGSSARSSRTSEAWPWMAVTRSTSSRAIAAGQTAGDVEALGALALGGETRPVGDVADDRRGADDAVVLGAGSATRSTRRRARARVAGQVGRLEALDSARPAATAARMRSSSPLRSGGISRPIDDPTISCGLVSRTSRCGGRAPGRR